VVKRGRIAIRRVLTGIRPGERRSLATFDRWEKTNEFSVHSFLRSTISIIAPAVKRRPYYLVMKIGYGGGWETRFLHLSASVVGVATGVSRNTTVARSGGTGSCTTGPHLHFEVRKDGVSQLVPGAVGTNVTRNTEVPRDYPGLRAMVLRASRGRIAVTGRE
jgi:hypothetical protein